MPFFFMPPDEIQFPPAHFADIDGQLAQGGAISADWLIAAYKNGAYLWASPMEPLKWWSPDPRIVLMPDQLDIPDEVETYAQKEAFPVRSNHDINECLDFCESIENAKEMYPGWVTGQFKEAYIELHNAGIARTISIRQKDELVACAVGAKIGNLFFGEHICGTGAFTAELALIEMARHLHKEGVVLMDVHKETNATMDIGLKEISKNEYLHLLKNNLPEE